MRKTNIVKEDLCEMTAEELEAFDKEFNNMTAEEVEAFMNPPLSESEKKFAALEEELTVLLKKCLKAGYSKESLKGVVGDIVREAEESD